MRPILYVETNFAIGVAKGQDPDGASLLSQQDPWLRLGFPTICLMEGFSVLNAERRARKLFAESLKRRAREHSRNTWESLASQQATDLKEAELTEQKLANLFETALHGVFGRLSEEAILLELNAEIVSDCLANQFPDDLTDNLILSCILWHSHRYTDAPRAFLSANHNDFKQPDVEARLEAAELMYFTRTDAAIGWLRSRPQDDQIDNSPRPDGLSG